MTNVVPHVVDQSSGQVRRQIVDDVPVNEGGTQISPEGEMSMVTPSSVSVTAGTPLKIGGTVAAGNVSDFSVTTSSGGRLVYTGATTRMFLVLISVSFTTGANLIIITPSIAKNGVVITRSEISRKVGTGTDVGAMPLQAVVELANGDFLELFVDINTSTSTVTCEKMNFFAWAH